MDDFELEKKETPDSDLDTDKSKEIHTGATDETASDDLKSEFDRIERDILSTDSIDSDKPDYSEINPDIIEPAYTLYTNSNIISYDDESEEEERKADKGTSFKVAAAIAAIVSILGGGALGLGIGIGIPISQSLFVQKTAEEPVEIQEPFKFPESESESAEVFTQSTVAQTNPPDAYSYTQSYASVIEQVEPSVVSIVSTVSTNFYNFSIPSEGAGSGILFHSDSKKYYIVTNYHVVGSAESVTVYIGGKGPFEAQPVGKRSESDISIISINKADVAEAGIENLTLATFGDSDAVNVGDVVLAIGNALGEGNTATNGIISAKNKKIIIESMTYNALQTNAAINPGNSGGPLINLNGEVIGINSAKLSTSTSSGTEKVEGMGYSIPSNDVKLIIEELMGPKKPKIGVSVVNMTEELANQFNLPQGGALIADIVKDSPAESIGLKSMDIITGFNGHTIFTKDDLINAVEACNLDDTVEVKYITNGKDFKTTEITLFEIVDSGF